MRDPYSSLDDISGPSEVSPAKGPRSAPRGAIADEGLSDVFQALSDPTRRGIVELLKAGPRSAGELAQAFPQAKSTLSAHFTVLRYAGLVSAARHGRHIVYRLNTDVLEEVVGILNGWLAAPPRSGVAAADGGTIAHSAERAHPPRHAEPERVRRRGAARTMAVEGGLAVLLAFLAGTPAAPATTQAAGAPPERQPGAGGPGGTAAPESAGGPRLRRRGIGHFIRFTG